MGIADDYVFSWAIFLRSRLSLFHCPPWLVFRIELVRSSCLPNAIVSLCGKVYRLYAPAVSERAAEVSSAHKQRVDVFTRVRDQKLCIIESILRLDWLHILKHHKSCLPDHHWQRSCQSKLVNHQSRVRVSTLIWGCQVLGFIGKSVCCGVHRKHKASSFW